MSRGALDDFEENIFEVTSLHLFQVLLLLFIVFNFKFTITKYFLNLFFYLLSNIYYVKKRESVLSNMVARLDKRMNLPEVSSQDGTDDSSSY